MIDGQNVFYDPLKSDMRTYDNFRKIVTDRIDDYTTGYLLDYSYFKEHYNMIAIDLSKQQAFNAEPKGIQQLILQETYTEQKLQQCFLLLKKRKKTF